MRTYDVSQGEMLIAHVTVDDAGQITWDFSPNNRGGYWMSEATKVAIEAAITRRSTAPVLLVRGFTIRQRASE